MPNWGDNEGRFWWETTRDNWVPLFDGFHTSAWVPVKLVKEKITIEIPHPPISINKGCRCQFCKHKRKEKKAERQHKKDSK